MAYQSRRDFRAALDSQKAAAQALAAAKGERYPVVAVNGNYGDVGETFGHSNGISSSRAGSAFLFSPAATSKATLHRRKPRYGSAKRKAKTFAGRWTTTFRSAYLNLTAAKEQVDVASQNIALANENLARSKDRFTSGVTDSVEVVQSEQS